MVRADDGGCQEGKKLELIAIDMPNGFTYIGKSDKTQIKLREVLMVETNLLADPNSYIEAARTLYDCTEDGAIKEKEVIIHGSPKIIHYLNK